MSSNHTKSIALGGILAAVCLVIFSLGGLIPFATYVCPMLCMMVLNVIFRFCGKRICWAWYAVVALLGLLIGPDKESVLLFALLGYYPILRPILRRLPAPWLWKILFFNCSMMLLYGVLLRFMGLHMVLDEYQGIGLAGMILILLLGNVVFALLEIVLQRMDSKIRVS